MSTKEELVAGEQLSHTQLLFLQLRVGQVSPGQVRLTCDARSPPGTTNLMRTCRKSSSESV